MKVKNVLLAVAAMLLLVLVAGPAQAGVNVGVGINIGLPVFSFSVPPQVAVIPGTYVYYVPDVDVDILFYQGRWYRPWEGRWYWSRDYNGPWVVASPRYLPAPLMRLPHDYRRAEVYERIPYHDFHMHWRTWEKERHWNRADWWRRGGESHHDHRDMRDDHRERRDDHRDMRDDHRERGDDRPRY
jgi:hypothetical protein